MAFKGKLSQRSPAKKAADKAPEPPSIVPINMRVNSKKPHSNPIRAFREELRLNRVEFAKLLNVSSMSIRTWESPNLSRPKGNKAVELVDLARANAYQLTLDDIYRRVV